MQMIFLVCLAVLPRNDCTLNTAHQVVSGPVVESAQECKEQRPFYEKNPKIQSTIQEGRYLKVICEELRLASR